MGLLDLSGTSHEQKTQLYFFDDGSFKFRKMTFEDACLVEKKNGEVDRGWAHFYGAELRFDGYKNIKADMITLSFNRDFILDPFNKVKEATNPEGGKPKKGDADIKRWTGAIAEAQRHKVMNKPSNMLLINKITIFLGSALILELLVMGASKAWG